VAGKDTTPVRPDPYIRVQGLRVNPNSSKVLEREGPWCLASASHSGGDPLLVAHDTSYQANPDEKPCSPCIYWGKDVPPATALTGDVPSQH
jgi:hypothetical protein